MKRLVVLLCVMALVVLGAAAAFAASDTTDHDVTITVNEVALINDVGNDPSFTIDVQNPLAAVGGESIVVTSQNEAAKWLQYTSIVTGDGQLRTITVEIDDTANIPDGTSLYVAAANPAAGGDGTKGTATVGNILLNGTDTLGAEDIVTGVGSCFTGTGAADGVNLTYSLVIDTVSDLFAANYTVNVLYTLTASAI